jgi:hypothetical protein
MRAILTAACFLAVSTGLAAQNKKFQSRAGKYAVAFPAEPKVESKKAGELTLTTAAVEATGLAYMVIYSDLPAATVQAAKPEDILESGELGLVNNFKAKVTKSQNTAFGKEKYPARQVTAEVKVDASTLEMRLNLVLVENRLYQILVIGSKDAVGKPATDKFFDSFEITK